MTSYASKNKKARQRELPGLGESKGVYSRSTEYLPAPVKRRVT